MYLVYRTVRIITTVYEVWTIRKLIEEKHKIIYSKLQKIRTTVVEIGKGDVQKAT